MNYSWYEQIIDPMCKASQIINMEEVTYSWGQKRSQISQRGWTKRLRVRVAKIYDRSYTKTPNDFKSPPFKSVAYGPFLAKLDDYVGRASTSFHACLSK